MTLAASASSESEYLLGGWDFGIICLSHSGSACTVTVPYHYCCMGRASVLSKFALYIVHMKGSGTNVFYFGCRHKDKDFLYHDELGQFASIIELTGFSVLSCSEVLCTPRP